MIELFEIIGLLIILWVVLYFRLKPILWIPLFALAILDCYFNYTSWYLLLPVTVLFIFTAAFTAIYPLRRRLLTEKAFTLLAKILPPISRTEQEALDAGDVWWEADLFQGRPHWRKLLSMPKPALSLEEQAFLDNQVEHLCSLLNDWQILHKDIDLPEQAWDYLKKERFFGLCIDKKFNGLGFSALAHSTIVTKIATRCSSAAVNAMVPNSLGPGELINYYGTEAQKNYYLPRLAQGIEIPCFALTSPTAGSDAGAMSDYGIVCKGKYQDKEIIGISLTWNKRYITLAPIATVMGLAFKLYDPDRLIGKVKDIGITLCLLPASHEGVKIGRRHLPLNLAFMNGPTSGENVFIPLDWVIGGANMVGHGWRMLMECLSIGRSISLPALACATGKMAYRVTGAYSRIRDQFNMPIGQFEGVEEALAKIAGYAYMMEAARLMTVSAIDQHVKPSVASAIAKYHMTEMARKVVNNAMDIYGGKAIQLGPKNYLAIAYQAAPISITVEGANILTRNLIIFGQGAMRCHPYVREEIAAIAEKNHTIAVKKLDKLLMLHVGYALSNLARSFFYGLTGGRFIYVRCVKPTRKYFQQLTRMSNALALLADFSMLFLGGELKRKERLSARLGDVLSQLYLGSAVLHYYYNNGKQLEDLDSVHWSLKTCLNNIQIALDEFFVNFPNPWIGSILKRIIFPYGRAYPFLPDDKLEHRLARQMQEPSTFRDRLTKHTYLSKDATDSVRVLETALERVIAAEDAYKKLRKALKKGIIASYTTFDSQLERAVSSNILSEYEKQLIIAAEKFVQEAIAVDDFDNDELTRQR